MRNMCSKKTKKMLAIFSAVATNNDGQDIMFTTDLMQVAFYVLQNGTVDGMFEFHKQSEQFATAGKLVVANFFSNKFSRQAV